MAYIYMDESGDLTLNTKYWSKFFVITFLIAKSEKETENIMKSIISNKNNINKQYKNDVHKLYSWLAWELLQQCEKRWFLGVWKHYFVLSRKETNQNLKEKFINYLNNSHSDLLDIDISIDIPQHKKGLEIVDACSHAIFRKVENWDFELYSVIKNKIILEKQIF